MLFIAGIFKRIHFSSTWLGASDEKAESMYEWTDGFLLTWTNWYPSKPNGQTGDNCLIRMYTPTPGQWDDKVCDVDQYQFYCEDIKGRIMLCHVVN